MLVKQYVFRERLIRFCKRAYFSEFVRIKIPGNPDILLQLENLRQRALRINERSQPASRSSSLITKHKTKAGDIRYLVRQI